MAAPTPPAADHPIARLLAAAICILYGFSKLNGAQFTILDSELTKPLGEVSGFWLTWHYFGYSKIYGTLIAVVQVGGGLLLIWPRTALLAALLLFPLVVNILLVDVFYGIDVSASMMAAVLLTCLAVIIAPHAATLRAAVLPDSATGRRPAARHVAVAVLFVACAFALSYWTANFNNRFPTPIDGVWTVVADTHRPPRWSHVFFERNRARMTVFRAPDGSDTVHDFRIADGAIRVQERWLDTSSEEIAKGSFDGDRKIRLAIAPSAGGGAIELERR